MKSKLIRFMVIYWAVIILLTYTAEWLGRHGPALGKVFAVFGIGIVLYVVARLVARHRRRSGW